MQRAILKQENKLTLFSGIMIVLGFILQGMGNTDLGNWALIIATILAGTPIAIKAFQALRYKAFSIELLVTIAVIGALFIQEYTESSVVTFLFLFGSFLEARTLEKTRSSIQKLTELQPQEANLVLEDGSRQTIDIDDVEVGNKLAILPGGRIPVDGRVLEGEASVNQAAITGESEPIQKKVGDELIAGTIMDAGYLVMEAEKVGDDTTFAKMIELVEEAQDAKSKTERFLDRFAQFYTPAVILLSLFVYLMTNNLHLAITFLVIACPGALVIGAPVSSVAGIGNGARNGVLIKGGDVMERMAKVDTLVFDKTGTLTKGKPEVTDFHIFNNGDRQDLLAKLAKVETISEHHLGRTVVEFVTQEGIEYTNLPIEEGEALQGRGVQGRVVDNYLVVGNRKLMNESGIQIPETYDHYAMERETKGNTAIFLAVDGQIEALISIADAIRDDAKLALQTMRNHGIQRIIMLTGDNERTAKAVANELGLDEYYAELMPEDKVTYVKKFKDEGAIISMAGDGINDAPALATADVGLAMGKGGTDVAMETADIVLMADELDQYAHAYALSKTTMANMRQNIGIALGVVAILLLGVLTGWVNLAIGMLVHEGSVLAVILNAMRLLGFKSQK